MELDQPITKGIPVIKSSLRLEVVEINKVGSQKFEILARDLKHEHISTIDKESDADADSNVNDILKKVLIEGVWAQNKIFKNSVIHLVNPKFDSAASVYSIDNSAGFLVTEPDNLLTCTLVASSLFCERKTWLSSVFLGQVGTNRAMLVGTLVHEVFQYGVKNRLADIDKLTKYLDELLDDATVMLEIYSVELHLRDVRAEAITYISSVKEWIEKYMFSGPKFPLTNESDLEVKMIGITDIEENVWSTKYGLKGKIDVTGSVRIYDKRNKTVKDKTIPLELKTGNPNLSPSHAAQVSLYSMMIEDRYSETNQGFVIYLKNKAAMHNIALTHNIKRDLIQRRNQINYHMKSFYRGPDMLDQTRMCKGCDRLTECLLMSNLYQPGKLEEFPGMKSLENEAVGHLDDKFMNFFQMYHEKLAAMMANSSLDANGDSKQHSTSNGSFWTWSSDEAESRGSGFGKLQASVPEGKPSNSGLYMFKRHPKHNIKASTPLSSQSDIEFVEIIEDNGDEMKQPAPKKLKIQDFFKPAVKPNSNNNSWNSSQPRARPFDTKLNFSRCRLAISLDDDGQTMDSQNSSTAIAIGFMNELKEDYFVIKIYEGALDLLKPDQMFRVDKLEKRLPIDIERTVLIRLLAREDWRCDRVKQLILDSNYRPNNNVKLNLFVLSMCFEDISELEGKQQEFVVQAVATDNYYILNETMGLKEKSKVHKIISVLARVILTLDRSLLVVAQNVDSLMNLMRFLQQSRIKFILLDDGKSTRARFQFAANLVKVVQNENWDLNKKFDAYIKQHESAPVVITTYAMSVGGLLFTRRTFDYCVAYDCDSTELLMSLSPMFCSDRHIIVDVREEKEENATVSPAAVATDTTNKRKEQCDRCGGHVKDKTLGDHLRSLRKVEAES